MLAIWEAQNLVFIQIFRLIVKRVLIVNKLWEEESEGEIIKKNFF